jgi:hypothetical protein
MYTLDPLKCQDARGNQYSNNILVHWEVIKRRLKRFDLAERKAAKLPKFKDSIQN